MQGSGHRRAILAVLLAFVYPGLGHVYLRAWFRALLWFGLAVAAAVLFVPAGTLDAAEPSLSSAVETTRNLPTDAYAALFGITAINMFDAYVHARRTDASVPSERCPNCRRDLDHEQLDDAREFCPWCAEELPRSLRGGE